MLGIMVRSRSLRFHFRKTRLEKLYTSRSSAHHYPVAVVDAFFEVVEYIRAAPDERDLYALKSLHYEKLQGREPERSLRLNRQWRLIVVPRDAGDTMMEIVDIEDYH
jgi:proteic killer suppression protein